MRISFRSLLLLVLAALPVSAQSFSERWKKRVATFVAENTELDPASRNVVLLGSSSMHGWDSRRRVAKFQPTVGPRTLNRGISGDGIGIKATTGIKNRLEASVFACRPSHVFLLNGRNSLGYSVERIAETYAAVLTEIRERMPDVVVCVITCAPVNHGYAKKRAKVAELNARLRTIAAETGCQLIDLHPLLVGDDGLMKPELTSDGLHFKDAGYAILGREIERVVAETSSGPREGGLRNALDPK